MAGQALTTPNRSPWVSKAIVNTQAFRFRLSIRCLIKGAGESRAVKFNETLNTGLSASDTEAFKNHKKVIKTKKKSED